jgi:hypothetical protein
MNPRHPSRQTYVLEQKRRRPSLPPVSESRLRAAASPAFDKALPERSPTYPWKKFPNGLEKRDTLAGTHFRLEGGGVEGALPLPPRSRSLRLAREREAGVWGDWVLPSANADAPTSLSNLLLLGPHVYRRNGSLTHPGGRVASKRFERGARPTRVISLSLR